MESRRFAAVLVFTVLSAGVLAGAALERDAALALADRVAPGGAAAVLNVDGRTDFPESSARAVVAAAPGARTIHVYRGEIQIAGETYTLVGVEGHGRLNGTASVASVRARPLADATRPLDILALRRVLPPVTVLHEMEFMRRCEPVTFAIDREVCRDEAASEAENVTVLRVSVPKEARRLAFHADVRELGRDDRPARWTGTFTDPSGATAARFTLEVPRGATALPPPFSFDGEPTLEPGTWTVRFALEVNGTAIAGLAGVVALDAPRPGAVAPGARSPIEAVPGRLLVAGPTTPPEHARDADLVTDLATAQALFGAKGRVTEVRLVEAPPGAALALAAAAREEALRSIADGAARDVTREALSARDLETPREEARVEAESDWMARLAESAPAILAAALAAALVLVLPGPLVGERAAVVGAVATAMLAFAFVLVPNAAFVLAPAVAFGAAGTLALASRAGSREAGVVASAAAALAVVVALAVVSASAAAAAERSSPATYTVTQAGPWLAVHLPDDAVVRLDGAPRPAGVVVFGAETRLAPDLPGLLESSSHFRGTYDVFQVLPTSPRAAVVTEPLTRALDGTPGAHGVGSTIAIPGVGGDVEFTVVAVLDARAVSAVFVAPANLDALFGGASSAGFARVTPQRAGAEPPGPAIPAVLAAAAAVFALGHAARAPRLVAAAVGPAVVLGAVLGLGAWRSSASARVAEAGLSFDLPAAAFAVFAFASLFAFGMWCSKGR